VGLVSLAAVQISVVETEADPPFFTRSWIVELMIRALFFSDALSLLLSATKPHLPLEFELDAYNEHN